MRTITKEYLDKLKNGKGPIAFIYNTPPPDFTELDKICKEFEEAMTIEHEKDREIMTAALKAAGRW